LNCKVDVVSHQRRHAPNNKIIHSAGSGSDVFWCPYPLPPPEFLASHLNISKYDILYINGRGFAHFAKYVKSLYNKKIVYSSRSNYLKEVEFTSIGLNPDKALLQETNLDIADGVVVASHSEQETLVRSFPGIACKCTVIPNPLHPAFMAVNPEIKREKVVLFVGRFIKQKGIEHLLSAIPKIINKENDICFKFIGGHGDNLITESIVESKAIYPNFVQVIDWLGVNSLIKEYSSSAILAMPSLYEPFGNAAIESMACSCPVVAFPIGGLQEIIKDGATGILTDQCNPSSLADEICQLLVRSEKRYQMGLNAHRAVLADYDYRVIALKYLDYFGKTL
jgi:glycosyltransferase involved in cell wall biosynthesis